MLPLMWPSMDLHTSFEVNCNGTIFDTGEFRSFLIISIRTSQKNAPYIAYKGNIWGTFGDF